MGYDKDLIIITGDRMTGDDRKDVEAQAERAGLRIVILPPNSHYELIRYEDADEI